MEMALVLADGRRGEAADPAMEAICQPIFFWARAVWHRWLPMAALRSALKDSRNRMAKAKRQWGVVRGPSAALVATVERIGWRIASTTELVTDEGRKLLLDADSPVVILAEAKDATRRWRLRNIQESVWWLGDPPPHSWSVSETIDGGCLWAEAE